MPEVSCISHIRTLSDAPYGLLISAGAVTPRVRLLTSEGAQGAALRSTLGHQLVQKAARLLSDPGPRGTPGEAALGALHSVAGRDGFRDLVAEMTGGYQVDGWSKELPKRFKIAIWVW